jgi:hypothetical protein
MSRENSQTLIAHGFDLCAGWTTPYERHLIFDNVPWKLPATRTV